MIYLRTKYDYIGVNIYLKHFLQKTICLFFSCLLIIGLLGTLCVFAAAEKSVDVTLNNLKASVSKGESFTAEIGFKNYSGVVGGIQSAIFFIQYDTSAFECSVTPVVGKLAADDLHITNLENRIAILYLDSTPGQKPITGDGAAIIATFKVKPSANLGTYAFTLNSGKTKTFVDCEPSSAAGKRDVTPNFPANSQQNITVSNATAISPSSSEVTSGSSAVSGGNDSQNHVSSGNNSSVSGKNNSQSQSSSMPSIPKGKDNSESAASDANIIPGKSGNPLLIIAIVLIAVIGTGAAIFTVIRKKRR